MHPLFDLTGRTALITGGAGLLGRRHAEAIAAAGGIPVILDINGERAKAVAAEVSPQAIGAQVDITDSKQVQSVTDSVLSQFGHIDILINNAANNPTMNSASAGSSRFEKFSLKQWEDDLRVGLTGAFICSQIVGTKMAEVKRGVILNIASDLAIIAPDQRLYEREGVPEENQDVKPVTYSVAKHGLLGLTKYLASYFGPKGIRVNALSPGGIQTPKTDPILLSRLQKLIPMGRMAREDEYQGAVLLLCSDASSYITGQNLIIDGGRCAA
ncbi:MAG TPA: SDR family oxidoreductase [Candidatus Peribacteraceae bacterium]|nr:SDR family oxidoreductase [Candidatus Peribacteraceae bacterium]